MAPQKLKHRSVKAIARDAKSLRVANRIIQRQYDNKDCIDNSDKDKDYNDFCAANLSYEKSVVEEGIANHEINRLYKDMSYKHRVMLRSGAQKLILAIQEVYTFKVAKKVCDRRVRRAKLLQDRENFINDTKIAVKNLEKAEIEVDFLSKRYKISDVDLNPEWIIPT